MQGYTYVRGSHETRVDDKGRLKLPAEYRKLLADGQEFYITSEDGNRAQLYPIAEWERKEQALSALPSMHPARQIFEDVTGYYGQMAEMDAQGRILLPALLRQSARIDGEVQVVGKIGKLEPGYLEVVNQDAYKATITARPITAEVKQQLSDLGV